MKKNNITSLVIFLGIVIVTLFSVVSITNVLKEKQEHKSYYIKLGDDIDAKIESLIIDDGTLKIKTLGNAYEYCVKTTKSTPNKTNLCWKEIKNNQAEIAIYNYKKYYIWIKDKDNNISIPVSINTIKDDKNDRVN